MASQYYIIGKVPGYNNMIDPHGDYESVKLQNLTIVDFIPVVPRVDVTKIKDINNAINQAIKVPVNSSYLYNTINKHSQYIKSWKGGYTGIRMLATADSAINNSTSHTYGDSIVSKLANSMADMFKKANWRGFSIGNVIEGIKKGSQAYNELTGNQYDISDTENRATSIAAGHHMHLPNMWENSTTNDILQLSIKLTSPSGDPKSIERYITDPLILLYIMSAPTSVTGMDFGTPFVYQVHAYGQGVYKLAGISNINFDRGGADVKYNIYQQPMTVNVRITVEPLLKDSGVLLDNISKYKDIPYQTPDTIWKSMQPNTDMASKIKKV